MNYQAVISHYSNESYVSEGNMNKFSSRCYSFQNFIIIFGTILGLFIFGANRSALALPGGAGEGGAQDAHEMSGMSDKHVAATKKTPAPIKKQTAKVVGTKEEYENEYLKDIVKEASKKDPENWTHKEIAAMGKLVEKEMEKDPIPLPEITTDDSQSSIGPMPNEYLNPAEVSYLQKQLLSNYADELKDKALKSLGASSKVIKGVGIVGQLIDPTEMGNPDDHLLMDQLDYEEKKLGADIATSYEDLNKKSLEATGLNPNKATTSTLHSTEGDVHGKQGSTKGASGSEDGSSHKVPPKHHLGHETVIK